MSEIPAVHPGAYSFTELFISAINGGQELYLDLMPLLRNVTISSSINQKAMTISMVIFDSAGIFKKFGLKGDELIVATWKTPEYISTTKQREIAFRITSIGGLGYNETADESVLAIAGISELGYVQSFTSVDNYFSDNISAAAQKVFDKAKEKSIELDKKFYFPKKNNITIDETEGTNDFIIPSDTPFDTMDYLASWAKTSPSYSNLFFFYQDLDGYNFKLLDNLFHNVHDISIQERSFNFSGADNAFSTITRPDIACKQVISFNQINRSSSFAYAESGAIHNTIATVDYFTKSVERKSLKYVQEDVDPLLTTLPVTDDFLDTFGKESNSTDWLHINKGLPNYIDTSDSHIAKKIYGNVFFNNLIQIRIPGNSDLDVGEGIYLNINEMNTSSNKKEADSMLSGKFLIKDLTHSFTASTYYQIINLCRIGDY